MAREVPTAVTAAALGSFTVILEKTVNQRIFLLGVETKGSKPPLVESRLIQLGLAL